MKSKLKMITNNLIKHDLSEIATKESYKYKLKPNIIEEADILISINIMNVMNTWYKI